MLLIRIGVAEGGDRAEAFGARRPNDAARDLAAVGDEDRGEASSHAGPFVQDGARFSANAARPSHPSGPRNASAKLFAAASI